VIYMHSSTQSIADGFSVSGYGIFWRFDLMGLEAHWGYTHLLYIAWRTEGLHKL
jgi:hypothetical protein